MHGLHKGGFSNWSADTNTGYTDSVLPMDQPNCPQGFGLGHSSGALIKAGAFESGTGVPHSKTQAQKSTTSSLTIKPGQI
jgi:hypothetical protein